MRPEQTHGSPCRELPAVSLLHIYGHPVSRASRPIWMAEELGIAYELKTDGFAGRDDCSPHFLGLNPNGTIPVIDDGGFILWESTAITLYLAKKHGGPLAPASLQEDALMTQWTLWAMTELEKPALEAVLHLRGLAPEKRDASRARKAAVDLQRPLAVLERALADRDYLVGDRFTAADLNVCSILVWARSATEVFAPLSRVATYLESALARPAYRALRERQRGTTVPDWVAKREARA